MISLNSALMETISQNQLKAMDFAFSSANIPSVVDLNPNLFGISHGLAQVLGENMSSLVSTIQMQPSFFGSLGLISETQNLTAAVDAIRGFTLAAPQMDTSWIQQQIGMATLSVVDSFAAYASSLGIANNLSDIIEAHWKPLIGQINTDMASIRVEGLKGLAHYRPSIEEYGQRLASSVSEFLESQPETVSLDDSWLEAELSSLDNLQEPLPFDKASIESFRKDNLRMALHITNIRLVALLYAIQLFVAVMALVDKPELVEASVVFEALTLILGLLRQLS